MLGVDPDYRGRGIGRMALRAGLSYLKEKGVAVVELTVDSENPAAYSLYESSGFRVLTRSLYYEKPVD
jgi:mycothiol synthase